MDPDWIRIGFNESGFTTLAPKNEANQYGSVFGNTQYVEIVVFVVTAFLIFIWIHGLENLVTA